MLDQSVDQSESQYHLPHQRWYIFPEKLELATQLRESTGLPLPLTQVLINRGIETPEQVQAFLNPESLDLPSPIVEFPDLAISVELLQNAIATSQKIAICGDYDADGMTSTALLLRSLRWLGAQVDYAIPSRMNEGYGINRRIVEEFHSEGVQLILTVDNGISAHEPVARARELGLNIIITDHHDLPPTLPCANAILNPKLLHESSPYRSIAGVGVAYILAISLAQQLGKVQGLVKPMLELFTLGTIADLAPLTGVNRRWVKRGLGFLPKSELAGIKALIQVANVGNIDSSMSVTPQQTSKNKSFKPDDIGFRLGPRINAVGRIADPQIVIELLTTDDQDIALEKAMECEKINQRRQLLCEEIEHEAIAWVENSQIDLQQQRVLVIVQPNWHHGVIGIVASRLVERYGVPTFIATYENDQHLRGSARSIPEFNIFAALQFCDDLLEKYGGHRAAGGFSLSVDNLDNFRDRLSRFAHQCLETDHLQPLIEIDALVNIDQINLQLYQKIDSLQPCGIDNKAPLFWTPNVRVIEQRVVANKHLKLVLSQEINGKFSGKIEAMAWRWSEYYPVPKQLDIAYRLRDNNWNGNRTIELELVGMRHSPQSPLVSINSLQVKAEFVYEERTYICSIADHGAVPELRIRNAEGEILAIEKGKKFGLKGKNRQEAKTVDLSHPFYYQLIKTALKALELKKN